MRVEPITLYISAASDLLAEREILGRAVAEMAVDLPWQISQSPLRSDPLDTDLVTQADIHLLLLGGDIRAPIGLEWIAARRAGRTPHLFLKKDVSRTAAGRDFVRFAAELATWRLFKDARDLRRQSLEILTRHTITHAHRYALSAVEVDRLQGWLTAMEGEPRAGEEASSSGAGDSGLILSRTRYMPSEGVIIDEERTGDGDGGARPNSS